uniref:Ig-like domain-containing protein n=1 Tax=Amphimedon queenslandica TaxID=400682 RepID=A0A1X7U7C0_AMPQE
MQSLVLFASVLVAMFGITFAQNSNYTEEYNWNGTLSVPMDGRQAIESGRIYVQLPNSSTPIDIRILENVSVTLDCGHLVTPSFERRNLNAVWKLRRRSFDGDLESNPLVFIPGTRNNGIEMFGNNGEFLRVANPTLASRIEPSNVGEFICEYNDHNIYKVDINIIGFSPVINRAGMLPSNSIRIGTNICIDPQSPVPVVRVVCAQIGSINPEPVSFYTFNNQPINHAYFFISQFSIETGLNNIIHVFPGLLLEYNMQGSLNCVLQNRFGNDSETTKILYSLPNVITVQRSDGTIVPPCPHSDNDLFVSCGDSAPGSAVAWYINGVLQSGNTGSRQRATVSGNYTCVISNVCGSVSNTTFIKDAPTIAPGTGIITNPGNTPVPAGTRTCVSRTGVGARVILVCNLSFNNESVSDVTFSWSTPGGGSQSGSIIAASSIGDYTCTASNQCGSSQATTEVVGRIELIKETGTGIDQIVNIGSRLCLNSGNPVTVNCNADFGTNVTRTWSRNNSVISGVTGSSYNAMLSDVGSTITCAVMNPCGMGSAATQVISQVPVTINGSISALNISDDGCNRPGITNTTADLCPFDGEIVVISCSSNEGYTISGPGGSSTDTPLVIWGFALSDSGIYICRSHNIDCGAAEDSILVSASGVPPLIRANPPGTPTLILPPKRRITGVNIGVNVCLLGHQFVSIDCWTQSGTWPITFTWTAASTGDRVIQYGMFLRVSANDTDVYTCSASNAFGTSTASSRVKGHLNVSLVGVSPQGNRCNQLRRRPHDVDYCAFVGDNLTLSCRVNDPQATTTIMYNRGGSVRGSDISISPVSSFAEGTYLCNATNDCGNSSDILNLRVYDPARIDRQQSLPTPGPNEVVIGAGRSEEPNNVTFGRSVKLFCPFTGIGQADATWLRVQPDGFTAEINTSLAVFSMNNTGNMSVLTISPFTEEFEGTYRCITTNIAGDDAGDVVLQTTIEVIPEWVTSPWSECNKICNGGYRTRNITCVSSVTNMTIDDRFCTAGTEPRTIEQCNIHLCPYQYVVDRWSPCSSTCMGGLRNRTVRCYNVMTQQFIDDSLCMDEGLTRPNTTHACGVGDCPPLYSWLVSHYGPCSVTCGRGTQSRTVTCHNVISELTAPDSFCSNRSKPPVTRECDTGSPCPNADCTGESFLCAAVPSSMCSVAAVRNACCISCNPTTG